MTGSSPSSSMTILWQSGGRAMLVSTVQIAWGKCHGHMLCSKPFSSSTVPNQLWHQFEPCRSVCCVSFAAISISAASSQYPIDSTTRLVPGSWHAASCQSRWLRAGPQDRAGLKRGQEGNPEEAAVSNAFAVAGALAHDLVPDSAEQVAIM